MLKKITSIFLILTFMILSSQPILAKSDIPVSPMYNNVVSVSSNATITENGVLNISYHYIGTSGVTSKAIIKTYIEKRTLLGLLWTRVDISTANNEWVDTINNYRYSNTRSYSLSQKGTYRIVIEYTFYGNGGTNDIVNHQKKCSY